MSVRHADFQNKIEINLGFKIGAALLSLLSLFGAGQAHALEFVAPNAIAIAAFPPPPAKNSEKDLEDLAGVLALQNARTPEMCARAIKEVDLSFANTFGPPYGPFSPEEILAGRSLYAKIFADTDYFTNVIKSRWRRARPFQASNNVHRCIPPHDSSSYPSGHAAISRITALTFSLVYPERAKELMARADEVALDRVIGGVHHPIDIEAGKLVADLLFAKMQENPKFLAAIEMARRARPTPYVPPAPQTLLPIEAEPGATIDQVEQSEPQTLVPVVTESAPAPME